MRRFTAFILFNLIFLSCGKREIHDRGVLITPTQGTNEGKTSGNLEEDSSTSTVKEEDLQKYKNIVSDLSKKGIYLSPLILFKSEMFLVEQGEALEEELKQEDILGYKVEIDGERDLEEEELLLLKKLKKVYALLLPELKEEQAKDFKLRIEAIDLFFKDLSSAS